MGAEATTIEKAKKLNDERQEELKNRENKITQKETKMEKWFKVFHTAEIKALEETAQRGQTDPLLKMDKQFAAIFLKATYAGGSLRSDVEEYLQKSKDQCREEWDKLKMQQSNFEIEKARSRMELRKTRAAREQWDAKRTELCKALEQIDHQAAETNRKRNEVNRDLGEAYRERRKLHEERKEVKRLVDE